MARGGWRGVNATRRTGFSSFSREWEELLLQTKFLAVGSSLGHLSMKKFFRSDPLSCPKIRQREGAGRGGGGQPPPSRSKS